MPRLTALKLASPARKNLARPPRVRFDEDMLAKIFDTNCAQLSPIAVCQRGIELISW